MAKVVYWSQTGNTEAMAQAVAQGIYCGIGYYTTGFSG